MFHSSGERSIFPGNVSFSCCLVHYMIMTRLQVLGSHWKSNKLHSHNNHLLTDFANHYTMLWQQIYWSLLLLSDSDIWRIHSHNPATVQTWINLEKWSGKSLSRINLLAIATKKLKRKKKRWKTKKEMKLQKCILKMRCIYPTHPLRIPPQCCPYFPNHSPDYSTLSAWTLTHRYARICNYLVIICHSCRVTDKSRLSMKIICKLMSFA